MQNLTNVLNEQQLETITTINEKNRTIKEFKDIKKILHDVIFEGYYEEDGSYHVTFIKEQLEKALAIIFDSNDAQII